MRHPDSINIGEVANLKSTGSVHCTKLLGHICILWTSFFDTDFIRSRMKLTKLPLIHCFVRLTDQGNLRWDLPLADETIHPKYTATSFFASTIATPLVTLAAKGSPIVPGSQRKKDH